MIPRRPLIDLQGASRRQRRCSTEPKKAHTFSLREQKGHARNPTGEEKESTSSRDQIQTAEQKSRFGLHFSLYVLTRNIRELSVPDFDKLGIFVK